MTHPESFEPTQRRRNALQATRAGFDAVIVGDAVGALEPLEPRAALAG